MFISNKYQTKIQKVYTNDEYLALQIWKIENIFQDTPGAIKDINFNYIAMTEAYAKEFEITIKQDCDKYLSTNTNHKLFTTEIKEHESKIINNLEVQDSVFIYKPSTFQKPLSYIMRKRPIINPSTNDVLGIFIAAKQHQVGSFRAQFLRHMFSLNKSNNIQITKNQLSDEQQRIILCLLYGYQSRKEIADIISENSSQQVNTIKIKNLLSSLYDKFECSTLSQLLQEIAKQPLEFNFIMDLVEEGNYLV